MGKEFLSRPLVSMAHISLHRENREPPDAGDCPGTAAPAWHEISVRGSALSDGIAREESHNRRAAPADVPDSGSSLYCLPGNSFPSSRNYA